MTKSTSTPSSDEFDDLSYPRLCALLGNKPSKLSQAMHNSGFASLGIPFVYVAFDTVRTEIGLAAMRELGIRGFSLTIPHKETALSLVDALSDEAVKVGAINTVIQSHGHLLGHNTDFYGVSEALRRADVEVESALVYGAGGASRAGVYALQQLGIKQISVCNRNNKRAEDLAKVFDITVLPHEELSASKVSSFGLFVNSSPLGLPNTVGEYPFELSAFGAEQVVFDMVTRDTPLLQAARAQGSKVVPGIEMLFYQALKQFELFTNKAAPEAAMRAALEREFSARSV